MIIQSIVAIGNNYEIGKNNQLIWHMPADLKHFKSITENKTVIMGRKSWESIGAKPLPNRPTILITKNKKYIAPLAKKIVYSLDETLAYIHTQNLEEIFILGGAKIYQLFAPYIQTLYLTKIKGDFEADTFFPMKEYAQFQKISETSFSADKKNKYDYSFCVYQRKQ